MQVCYLKSCCRSAKGWARKGVSVCVESDMQPRCREFYCCPVTRTLLCTLLYVSLTSYQLERCNNRLFPESAAKTPFSTITGKKKIKKKCKEKNVWKTKQQLPFVKTPNRRRVPATLQSGGRENPQNDKNSSEPQTFPAFSSALL